MWQKYGKFFYLTNGSFSQREKASDPPCISLGGFRPLMDGAEN